MDGWRGFWSWEDPFRKSLRNPAAPESDPQRGAECRAAFYYQVPCIETIYCLFNIGPYRFAVESLTPAWAETKKVRSISEHVFSPMTTRSSAETFLIPNMPSMLNPKNISADPRSSAVSFGLCSLRHGQYWAVRAGHDAIGGALDQNSRPESVADAQRD